MVGMKKSSGFTVIELVVAITFLIGAAIVAGVQINKAQQVSDNTLKKTAINAIYYSLEESFHKQNGYYPETITDETLTTMDKDLLVDPNGKKLGEANSAYRYEAQGCENSKCKSYTLRASLFHEEDFVKESRNK